MSKSENSNIYLIGYRACGKTTVGRLLAAEMKIDFVDTDALTVSTSGCEISEIVARGGWESFRDLETAELQKISSKRNLVVSCGGGIILRPLNREILSKAFTVYLEAPADVIAKRLELNPLHEQRPSLTGKSSVDEVREVLQQRINYYKESALITVDATRSPEDIVAEILEKMSSMKEIGYER